MKARHPDTVSSQRKERTKKKKNETGYMKKPETLVAKHCQWQHIYRRRRDHASDHEEGSTNI